jgi:hypothetical protein
MSIRPVSWNVGISAKSTTCRMLIRDVPASIREY